MCKKNLNSIPMTQKNINHVDLFAGPGGFCTGFRAAGLSTLLAVEKVQSCVDTYRANHPDVAVIHKDIRDVSDEDLAMLQRIPVDVITSGMPCETFSTAGAKSRSSYDHRQQLYYETIRIAQILNPRIILFENVLGILSKKTTKDSDRLIIDDIKDDLITAGYINFTDVVLNSVDFGVPQKRSRFFLIATNDENLELKIPAPIQESVVTVDDCFEGLPILEANQAENHDGYTSGSNAYINILQSQEFWKLSNGQENILSYHKAPNHRPKTLERFKLIKQGENLRDAFTKHSEDEVKRLQESGILPKKWYIQRNMRLIPNEPSKTVTSHCLDEFIHPQLDRALTVREVARLQSFPDSYDFKGGPYICPHLYETQDKYEQIGDAVPPLLAYAWGNTIKEILGGVSQ